MPENQILPLSLEPDVLFSRLGHPDAPILIDVRTNEDFDRDPFLIPTAHRKVATDAAVWAHELRGQTVVVICDRGLKLSEGAAALLRHAGARASVLQAGFQGWKSCNFPLIPISTLPSRDALGRTLWVTRARPKIDRIACPWLIRRFVDPKAVFLFVAAAEVQAVADRFNATPFGIEGVTFTHRGSRCSFDAMVEELGLASPHLCALADIVRAADTAQLEAAPQAAGLLALSLGLSTMYDDDLKLLDAGMMVYDALYRWLQCATAQTHAWSRPSVDMADMRGVENRHG